MASMDTPFYIACRTGNMEMVEYSIYKDHNNVNEGFYEACKGGHLDIVKYLMDRGVDKLDLGLYYAASYSRVDVVKFLVEECNITALHRGLHSENLDIIKYLISKGADTSLCFSNACFYGVLNTIKYLLEEHKTSFTKEDIKNGISRAGAFGHSAVAEYLIDYLGDECKIADFNRYLQGPYELGDMRMVKKLIEKGANKLDMLLTRDILDLLNLGIKPSLLGDKATNFIIRRNYKNKPIKELLLKKTAICKDVIDLICSYLEYTLD